MSIGQRYTEAENYIKWAIYGDQGTGKTHFAIDAARLKPKTRDGRPKNVVIFNLEPIPNLMSVLPRFPDVYERTTVLPTQQELEEITKRALQAPPTESDTAFDAEMSWYVIEKTRELEKEHYDEIKDTFFIFDTASQIYRKLTWQVMEKRESDEALMRLGPLGYTPVKMRFQIWVNRMALWPTDVIWLGRTKQGGQEVTNPKSGKTRWKPVEGKEDPEWKDMMGYPATTIIYLTKKEAHIIDSSDNSLVMDPTTGKPMKEYQRFGKIEKHKSGRRGVPTIKDPTPAKVMAWLRGLS